MEHGCEFCGSDQIMLPGIGISFGMYGFDFDFCRSCLEGMPAAEFWRQLFQAQGYAWPPRRVERAPEVESSPGATPITRRRGKPTPRQRERGKMSNALRYKVMRRDGFHCQLCGKTGKEAVLVVDHIEPIARGGKTDIDNLRTLCRPCNAGKGTKLDSDN